MKIAQNSTHIEIEKIMKMLKLGYKIGFLKNILVNSYKFIFKLNDLFS